MVSSPAIRSLPECRNSSKKLWGTEHKQSFAAAESPFSLELAFLGSARCACTPRRWAGKEGCFPAGMLSHLPIRHVSLLWAGMASLRGVSLEMGFPSGMMSLCFSVKAKPRCLSGLRPCRGAAATRGQAVSAGKHRCCRKASPRVNPGSWEGWACCVPAGVQNLLGLCALIAWKVVFPFPLFIFNAESAQNCSKL